MQDKSKLGKRYQCFQCGLNFYDLNRPEPLCPKCGADQRDNPNPDPREAILARFKGKAASKGIRVEESFDEEEDSDEETEVEADGEDIDDDDEPDAETPAGGDEED